MFESILASYGVILVIIYFLPLIIAALRSHKQFYMILLFNFFLGWTFIAWWVLLFIAAFGKTHTVDKD